MVEFVHHVNNIEEYLKLVTESVCVVKFTADWCSPCRKISPLYQKLSVLYRSKIRFIEVDVDHAHEISKHESVNAIPLFLFYDNGKLLNINVRGGDEESLISNVCLLHEHVTLKEVQQVTPAIEDGTFSFHDSGEDFDQDMCDNNIIVPDDGGEDFDRDVCVDEEPVGE